MSFKLTIQVKKGQKFVQTMVLKINCPDPSSCKDRAKEYVMQRIRSPDTEVIIENCILTMSLDPPDTVEVIEDTQCV